MVQRSVIIIVSSVLRSKIFKFFLGALLAVLITLLVAFNVLLVWVATGPRTLDELTPYIESSFNTPDSPFAIKIENTVLLWDGWRNPVDIRLRNVAVLTHEGVVFSTFPDIALGVDFFSLPFGRFMPTTITLTKPVISLLQNEDRSITFGLRQEDAPTTEPAQQSVLPFAAILDVLMGNDAAGSLSKLKRVYIRDADISIGNARHGILLETHDTNFLLERTRGGFVHASAYSEISYEEREASIKANLTFSRNKPTIEGKVELTRLYPTMLSKLVSDYTDLKDVNVPLSGRGDFIITREGKLERLDFVMEAGKGTIAHPRIDGTMPVNSFYAKGTATENGRRLDIITATANLEGMLVAANADVNIIGPGDVSVRGEVNAKHIPADHVRLFWPLGVSPQSREWITENIRRGQVDEAIAKINIAPGDLLLPVLPREAVDATILVSGASVRFLPNHPEITNIDAVVKMDAITLNCAVTAGRLFSDLQLSEGNVNLEDLNLDNPYLKVNVNAQGPSRDAVKVLAMPRINRAKRFNLQEDAITGTVKGAVELGFYFFSRPGEDDVAYHVKAELKELSQNGILNKFDVKGAEGTMTIDDKIIEFSGKGEVNGMTLTEATIKNHSTLQDGYDTFISGAGTTPITSLPRFGVTLPPWVKGAAGVKGMIKQGPQNESYEVTADLANTQIAIAELGWSKGEKIPATLELAAQRKGSDINISAFNYSGGGMAAQGSARLAPDMSGFSMLALDKFNAGRTQLDKLRYETQTGGFKLSAKGSSADLSGYMAMDSGEGFSFAKFPAVDVSLDLGQVRIGEGRQLNSLKGELKCDTALCSAANLSGTVGENKPFTFRIQRAKGKRQLAVTAADSGSLFYALDIFDSIEGGEMTITGQYDDANPSTLKGRMDIGPHTIRDAPVLARILSLASLTGFFDTLRGNGIAFKKFTAPFTLHKDIITIEKAKTFGPAIGLTGEGTVTMPKVLLDISGAVVPSYTLNSVLGNVPLVGGLLTGGDGGGVFAARYSIKGDSKNPDVSVNPLSMLTPGFLRGLFDIFEDKKPEAGEAQ